MKNLTGQLKDLKDVLTKFMEAEPLIRKAFNGKKR